MLTTFRPLRVSLGSALLVLASQASAIDITFDNLAAGTTLGAQYSGVLFSPNAFSGAGGPTGDWATNTNMTIVSTSGTDVGGLGTPSLVSGNVLRSFSGWLDENGDPSFRVSFATAITAFSADFAGVEAASGVRLLAYDGSALLGSTAGTGSTGQFTLSFSAAHVTSVVVIPGSFEDWVAVDNVRYTPAIATPVPEPGTWALTGLGLLAVVARRRARPPRR